MGQGAPGDDTVSYAETVTAVLCHWRTAVFASVCTCVIQFGSLRSMESWN